MPLILKKQIPFTITIEGEAVRLYLKRMTIEEYAEFSAEFIARNKAEPSESIVRSRADQARRDIDEGLDYAKWVCAVFDQFVVVHPGDLQLENQEITKGSDFARTLAAYGNVVSMVLVELFRVNRLTAEQKKTLSLPRASETGSTPAPSVAASGAAPATTAGSVEQKGSAPSGPASEARVNPSSGETAPSSSAGVPSAS